MLRMMISFLSAALLLAGATGCTTIGGGTSSGGGMMIPTGPKGGPAKGPADTHCQGKTPQTTSMSVCQMKGTTKTDYGPPMYGTEGDDDDCKYHVTWKSTDIYEDYDTTFTFSATRLTDGKPATGSLSYLEVFLNDKHPAPNTNPEPTTTEGPPGTYVISPYRFDAKGKWTVRLHLYEQCTDVSDESPHGHAAFYIDVP
jgi:hypothetical protein